MILEQKSDVSVIFLCHEAQNNYSSSKYHICIAVINCMNIWRRKGRVFTNKHRHNPVSFARNKSFSQQHSSRPPHVWSLTGTLSYDHHLLQVSIFFRGRNDDEPIMTHLQVLAMVPPVYKWKYSHPKGEVAIKWLVQISTFVNLVLILLFLLDDCDLQTIRIVQYNILHNSSWKKSVAY